MASRSVAKIKCSIGVYKLLDEKVKISVMSISEVQEDKGKLFNLLTDISEMEKYSKKYHRS